MQLSPGQLSALNEMGIPVWDLRQQTSEQIQLGEQLLQCDWLVVIEQADLGDQEQRLLQAMLSSIGLSQQDVMVVTHQQLLQLKNNAIKRKLVLVLGFKAAQPLLDEEATLQDYRGKTHQIMDSQCTAIISFGLEELLTVPENKALAWQDLKLARQTFEQFS